MFTTILKKEKPTIPQSEITKIFPRLINHTCAEKLFCTQFKQSSTFLSSLNDLVLSQSDFVRNINDFVPSLNDLILLYQV